MKKAISLAVRLLLAAAGVAYIVVTITWRDQFDAAGDLTQQGVFTMLREARWSYLGAGFALVALIFPTQALRWLMLMRARGMAVTYSRAMRLTLVGTFFNFCMPGTTGGDVIKAYYAAARSDRRADAVMSVLVDRVTGLLGLIVLSGLAGLFILEHPVVRNVTLGVWLLAGGVAGGAALYFSRSVRRKLRLGVWMHRLPGGRLVRTVDAAAVAYRQHRGTVAQAVALSVGVHLVLASATALAGYALGMEVPLGVMLSVIPVIFLLGAVPLTPQGFGVMEVTGTLLLQNTSGATANQIIAMLLIARLYQIAFGLAGALLLFRGNIHLHEAREAIPAEVGEPSPGDTG